MTLHRVCVLPLRGAGGEPVSFVRTINSHGCAALAPASVAQSPPRYRRALRIGTRAVDVTLREEAGALVAESPTRLGARAAAAVRAAVRRMFRLDDDLTPFYRTIAGDPVLSWAADGAGRMLASPTVFEDVIKTICTTNCAWSATIRMTQTLVARGGGAFPEPDALAETPDTWFAGVARMGYRGPYIRAIARDVAAGALDLECLVDRRRSDDDVAGALLALPGVGPYAAAHVMQLLGRHRRLVLDSWTRPTYARLARKKRAADATIQRAFRGYGDYAGLAFWLFLTRDWVDG